MGELSKGAKIVFFINAIIAFIYAFLFIAIPEIYSQLMDGVIRGVYSPKCWRQLGVSILVLGIGAILAISSNDTEKAKIFWDVAIIWLILMLAIGIWGLFATPQTSTSFVNDIIAATILAFLAIINAYFYYQETQ